VSLRRLDRRKGGGVANADPDAQLRSAISIFLIAERRSGATIGQLARLELGGQSPVVELPRVAKAASQLLMEGLVTMEGDTVCPVLPD
jgi:hypothetical protein